MIVMELKNVNKSYQKNNEKIEALKNINISFESGKLYAIMGQSGSGKSTLIRILGLMDKFDNGEYILDNINTKELNDISSSQIRMKKIGFVFQDYYLDECMSALENITLPMLINKDIEKKEREKIATNLLEKMNLINRKNHLPKELSGGEQQRICIARALANNPEIILADEPTGNLDKENEKIIFSYLKALADEGKCIIVVSHSEEVKQYASEIIYLNNGTLVRQ